MTRSAFSVTIEKIMSEGKECIRFLAEISYGAGFTAERSASGRGSAVKARKRIQFVLEIRLWTEYERPQERFSFLRLYF